MLNLNILEQGRAGLIVNLHKLNDMRWFNRYFLLSHEKLRPGGCLVGKAHTISTHRDYFRDKYPGFLGEIFYGLNVVFGMKRRPNNQKILLRNSPAIIVRDLWIE